nr:hypothetical protein [uncultured Desulfobacter sp.]
MKFKRKKKNATERPKKKKLNWNILSQVDRIRLKRPGKVIVFETTGFKLYARVARAGIMGAYKIGEPVVSTAADFSKAVKEVKDQLKAQNKILPKKAVLITPNAAGDLLSLPVDPKKPRPRPQMAEMVRWELEELFLKLGDMWSLGAVLQGCGIITWRQRLSVEQATAFESGPASTANNYDQYASAEQIGQCLEIQEILMGMDEELVPGWTPQTKGDAPFIWYGAGIGQGIRERWTEAFKKNDLFLTFIYPRLGAALPMADLPGGDGHGWLFLDICQEQAGLFQGVHEQLESFSSFPTQSGLADPAQVAGSVVRFIHPGTTHIFILCEPDLFDPIAREIEQSLGRSDIRIKPVWSEAQDAETVLPEPDTRTDHETASAQARVPMTAALSMEGVARHALKRCTAQRQVRIEAQDPKPPVWKNKALLPWAVIFLIAAGIGANSVYMKKQTEQKQWELELLDIEYDRRIKIKKEAQSTSNEASRLMRELDGVEAQIKEQQRLKVILDQVIRYRQHLVPDFLTAIGSAVTDQVMIDLVEEDTDRQGFYMEAWALNDTDGQLFGKNLNEVLVPLKYKVADLQSTAGKGGGLDLDGYNLKIKIRSTTPPVQKAEATSKKSHKRGRKR